MYIPTIAFIHILHVLAKNCKKKGYHKEILCSARPILAVAVAFLKSCFWVYKFNEVAFDNNHKVKP